MNCEVDFQLKYQCPNMKCSPGPSGQIGRLEVLTEPNNAQTSWPSSCSTDLTVTSSLDPKRYEMLMSLPSSARAVALSRRPDKCTCKWSPRGVSVCPRLASSSPQLTARRWHGKEGHCVEGQDNRLAKGQSVKVKSLMDSSLSSSMCSDSMMILDLPSLQNSISMSGFLYSSTCVCYNDIASIATGSVQKDLLCWTHLSSMFPIIST